MDVSGFFQRRTMLDVLKCFPFLFSFSLARVLLTAICLGVAGGGGGGGGVIWGVYVAQI